MVGLKSEEAQSRTLDLRRRGVSNSTGKHSGQYVWLHCTNLLIVDSANLRCSSHRERKELHMHELELQVIRDKQVHLETVEQKNAIEHENRLLRELLDQHGIFYPTKNQQQRSLDSGPSGGTDQSSRILNFGQSPSTSHSAITPSTMPEPASFRPDLNLEALQIRDNLDYNEIALSFVLKLVLLGCPLSQSARVSCC